MATPSTSGTWVRGRCLTNEDRSQITRLFGEITRLSSHDCGSDFLCYILDHDGVENLIRVLPDNDWGLDVDYDGGLCAEVIAPVGVNAGDTGTVSFLDVRKSAWMRTWEM